MMHITIAAVDTVCAVINTANLSSLGVKCWRSKYVM